MKQTLFTLFAFQNKVLQRADNLQRLRQQQSNNHLQLFSTPPSRAPAKFSATAERLANHPGLERHLTPSEPSPSTNLQTLAQSTKQLSRDFVNQEYDNMTTRQNTRNNNNGGTATTGTTTTAA